MSAPFLASITLLSGAQPKGASATHLAMITPLSGERPGHDLPEGGGHPDGGLPWAPARPGHDLPTSPGHPDTGLPFDPARPDNGLPVPPDVISTLPMPGGDLSTQNVVLVYRPGQGWVGKSYPPAQPKA